MTDKILYQDLANAVSKELYATLKSIVEKHAHKVDEDGDHSTVPFLAGLMIEKAVGLLGVRIKADTPTDLKVEILMETAIRHVTKATGAATGTKVRTIMSDAANAQEAVDAMKASTEAAGETVH